MSSSNRSGFYNPGSNRIRKERTERATQRKQPQYLAGRDKALRTPQPHLLDPTVSNDAAMHNRDFKYCPDRKKKYQTVAKIGQGTFGEVFKARATETGRFVALKKIIMDSENRSSGFPMTSIREIKILNALKDVPCENIVELIEICRTRFDPRDGKRPEIHLVFEFCDHDLAGLLQNKKIVFSLGEKKQLAYQLFNGLYALHANKILHRDLKSANILITKKGVLKLADFGLARPFSVPKDNKENRYTNRVVTLWYRPPELLLGARNYGPEIDMWGAGCVMAELWTRTPIMQGNNEQDQLSKIQRLCGGITPEVWSDVVKLNAYRGMLQGKPITKEKRKLRGLVGRFLKDEKGLEILEQLLTLDPEKRLDCEAVLDHEFFWSNPMPCSLEGMLSKLHKSMFDYTESMPKNHQQSAQQHSAANRPAPNFTGLVDRVF
ncbi:unnamed protein product [Oikopleura dioica]|uniref:CDK9b protein n=2 Tax=Oikopleura dioica TaxID=34765 RepID=E4XAT4_OIKDI|nr:unnamed protein product [Oikopleura dioica]CBZ42099.1 CDK9b protein [Oikopleura dioica]